MDNQIYISQLSTSLFFYQLLFELKKTDVKLNKTLKSKLMLTFFDSVYLTRPSNTVTKYTIYLPILLVERLFKWSWVLSCDFILWLAKPDSKNLPTQDLNSYYLVVPIAKMPKIIKRMSSGVCFSICKSQDHAINYQRIIPAKLIDCLFDTCFSIS